MAPLRRFATVLTLLLLLLEGASALAKGSDLGAIRRLLGDPSPSARASALRRLAGDESPAALALLRDRLADEHPYVRRACAGVLGQVLEASRRRALLTALRRHRSEVARAEACRVFALWADAQGLRGLEAALGDRAAAVRASAVRWYALLLGARRAEWGAPAERLLVARAADADAGVRAEAVAVLPPVSATFPAPERAVLLKKVLSDRDARVRVAALGSSVAVGGEEAVVAVLHGLTNAVWSVRLAAAELARVVPERRVLEGLVPVLADERVRVRAAAHTALVHLTGIPFEPVVKRWRVWLEGEGRSFDLAAYAASPRARTRRERRFDSGTETVSTARFLGLAIESRHVAFVLDVSASMRERTEGGETRWEVVLHALRSALRTLRTGRRAWVNVHMFSDEVESVFDRARELTSARVKEIERRLAAKRPGGRTALYDGIEAALSDPEVDSIVVLSDGAPSAGRFFTKTDLLGELRLRNRWRRARIDVIAVGSDGIAKRWRDVLKRIASESGGRYVERK